MWEPRWRQQQADPDSSSAGDSRPKHRRAASNISDRSDRKPAVLARKLLLPAIVLLVALAIPAGAIAPVGTVAADSTCQTSTSADASTAGAMGTATVGSSTVYVEAGATGGDGSSSDPYGTIQAAVDNASQGTTVIVRAGTYEESVEVEESVHLLANDDVLMDGSAVDGPAFHVENTSHPLAEVTVSGFEIENYDTGIEVGACNQAGDGHVDLRDVTLEDNTIRSVERGIAFDLVDGTSESITVENNTVSNAQESGVFAIVHGSASNVGTTIADNDLSDTKQGIAFELADETSVEDLAMVENTIERATGSGHGVSVEATDDVSVRGLRLSGNHVDASAGNGIHLVARGASTIETVDVVDNTLVGSGDAGVELRTRGTGELADFHVEQNEVVDNAVGVTFDGGPDGSYEDVTVERNVLADNDAGVDATAATNTAGIAVHYNVIAENGVGVDNLNESGLLDARFNWWGDSTGPSTADDAADAPVEGPASGVAADGQGDSVSEGETEGVSNVRFYPAVGAKSTCADDSQLLDPAPDREVEFTFEGRTIDGDLSDFLGLCVWERAPLPVAADHADAASKVESPQVFLRTDGGDVQVAGVGSNRPYANVFQAGEPITLSYQKVTGADSERFAGDDAELLVVRANESEDVADAFSADVDGETGEVTLGTDAAEFVDVRDLEEIDANGGLDEFEVTPSEPGTYLVMVATANAGDGLEVTADGNLTFDAITTSRTVVGATALVVQETGSTVTPNRTAVEPGGAIQFDAASNLDRDDVSHAVVLYDEATFSDTVITTDPSVERDGGNTIVNVSGIADGDPFFVHAEASGDGTLGDLTVSGELDEVDSDTAVVRTGDETEALTARTGTDWREGDYRWIHVAVADDDVSQSSTAVGTVTVGETADPAGAPEISVSPTSYDFGDVAVGGSEWTLVKVSNQGDAPLKAYGAELTGADAGEFRIARGGKSSLLAPGEWYTVKVRYEPTTTGSASATLQIPSNDTDTGTVSVPIAGNGESTTQTEMTSTSPASLSVDVDRIAPGNATVEIRNAEADEPVNVTFDGGVGYDGVYLDGLDLELDRDADEIDLDIRHRRSEPDETPRLRLVAGADRYVQIEKSGITDEGIDAARFHFRVSEDVLDDREPENVALHRYSDGEWSTLSTTFVEERNGDYVFRATSPGFSAFAVGVQQAQFEVNGTDLAPTTVTAGESATVTATIENVGEAEGTFTAGLAANGETVTTSDVTLDAGESTTVAFEVAFENAGEYDLAVNGTDVGTLSVEEEPAVTETTAAPTTDGPATTASSTTDSETTDVPLVGLSMLAILLVAITGAALYFRTELRGLLGR